MELTIVKSKEEFELLREMYSQKHNGAYVYFMYTKIKLINMSKTKLNVKELDLFKRLSNVENLAAERAEALINKMYRDAKKRIFDIVDAIESKKEKLSELKDLGVKNKMDVSFEIDVNGLFENIARLEYDISIDNFKLESYKKTFKEIFGEEYSD